MKKLFKPIIPFFIALIIAVSASPLMAFTMSGCGSALIQGCQASLAKQFPASLISYLDAAISASFPGSGDDWLDANGDPNYDFFLGRDGTTNGEEPVFLGTAGDADAAFLFDGGDRVPIKVNTSFTNRLHKTDETDLGITFSLAFYWPLNPLSGVINFFGTANTSSSHGLLVGYDNTNTRFNLTQYNNSGGGSVTNMGSTVNPVKGAFNLLTVSFQKTSGTGGTYRLSLNDDTVLTGSLATYLTSTTDATQPFQWSGVQSSKEFFAGMKMKAGAIFNGSLTQGQEDDVKSVLESRYDNTFPTSTETVRHLFWNSPSDLLAANTDSLDVTSESFFDNDQGFMVVRYKAPSTFQSYDYLMLANGGGISDSAGLRINSTGSLRIFVQDGGVGRHNDDSGDILIPDRVHASVITWKPGESSVVSGGMSETKTYTGDPAGMDTINFAARNTNLDASDLTFYDAYIGNTHKTLAELQQYLYLPDDILAAGGGQSLMTGLFDSSDTSSFQGKQNFRSAVHAGIPDNNTVVFKKGSTGGSFAARSGDTSDTKWWWDNDLGIQGPAFDTFKAAMDDNGYTPNVLIWSQGESDSDQINKRTTKQEYKDALTSIFNDIRSTYGPIPVVIQRLGRRTSEFTTGGGQIVRDVQIELAAENSWIHIGPDSYDQPLFDGVHLSDSGYEVMGTRLGNKVLEVFGYTIASANGPSISSAVRSGTTVTVTIAHDRGTDFTPATGYIEGFRFFNNTAQIEITNAVRTNATTITLTLASTPTGTETLYYIYDTDKTLVLAGRGLELERFTAATNPPTGWAATGNSNVVSGELVSITTGASSYLSSPTFSATSEIWASFDTTLDSGADITSTATGAQKFFSIRGASTDIVRMSYRYNGSDIEYSIQERGNGGVTTTSLGTLPTLGAEDTFTVHWKKETGVGTGDSIFQVFQDGLLVIDRSGDANDTINDATFVRAGAVGPAGTSSYTVRTDNVQVGTASAISRVIKDNASLSMPLQSTKVVLP
jgi:hypothetical protein